MIPGSGMQSERWETIDGIRTRYLEAGSGDRTILFIHGLGSSADRWLDIPLALSLHFRTIAVDLPGFGMSGRPESGFAYGIDEYSGFIVKLIKRLGIGQTAIVGHSLGGYIASDVAARTGLVDRLVLIDSSGTLNGPTGLLKDYLSAAMNPSRESVRTVFEQLVANPTRIPDVLVDGFIYRMNIPGAKNAFKLAYEKSVNTQIGLDSLKKISCKTMIIWGKEDRLIPLDHHTVFHGAIKGSAIELIEDAGHAPFAEKPALTCELIRQFLSSY